MSTSNPTKSQKTRKAPLLLTTNQFYEEWDGFDSGDELLDITNPIRTEDEELAIKLKPYLVKYGHWTKAEANLLHSLWDVASTRHTRKGHYPLTFHAFLFKMKILSPLAFSILESKAARSCNYDELFHKLSTQGWLKIPGPLSCILDIE